MMNQFITLLTVSAYVFSANVLTVVVVNAYRIAAMIVVNISNSAAVMGVLIIVFRVLDNIYAAVVMMMNVVNVIRKI